MGVAKGVYKMRSISQLTGFSPELLRAWETRHGFLEPERRPSGHRLYTADDLAVLRTIRALLDEGRAIGEIAALGRDELLARARRSGSATPKEAADDGALRELENEIVEGARALDPVRLSAALDEAFARVSPAAAIDRVVLPAAHRIGDLWESGELDVASEHLATGLFTQRLHRLLDGRDASRSGRPTAISACLPDEPHELGALVVAFHVANLGYQVAHLGASMPVDDLVRACERLEPELVLLSSTRPELVAAQLDDLLRAVREITPRTRLWIGGAGVSGHAKALEAAGAHVWPADRPLSSPDASALLEAPRSLRIARS